MRSLPGISCHEQGFLVRSRTVGLLLFLFLGPGQPYPAWAAVNGGRLGVGESIEKSVLLKANESAAILIGKQAGDLQIVVKSGNELIRELVSPVYSVAPVRLILYSREPAEYRIVLSNPGKGVGAVQYTLSMDPPHPAVERDAREFEAEAILFPAPPTAHTPRPSFDSLATRTKEAADFFEETGDSYALATAFRQLGRLYSDHQDFAAAREAYLRSKSILEASPWRFEEGVVRQNLAYIEGQLGESLASIAEMNGVLAIREELHDDLGRGITLFGLANAHHQVGDLQESLDSYRAALALFRKLGETRWESTVLNAMGLLDAELGRVDAAAVSYAEASALAARLHDRSGLMMTTNNIGLLKEAQGAHEEARAGFREAIRLAQELGDRRSQSYALQNIGDVDANEGHQTQALEHYEASLEIKRQLSDVAAAAETKRKMGLSYIVLGRLDKARSLLEEALTESRGVADRTGEARSLAALARLEDVCGLRRTAEDHIAEAIHLIETTRVELRARDLRTSYFSTQHDFYDFAIDLAMEKGGSGPERALEWSERERARTLLDAVHRASAPAAAPFANTLSAAGIRGLLDPGTVLVEYSVGPNRTYAWVVSATAVRAVRMPGWQVIAPALTRLRDGLNEQQHDRLNTALREVASLIWWPLAIPPATRLVISGGALDHVPFAALPSSDQGPRLIEQAEVISIPSASLAAAIRQRRGEYPQKIAIFADPVFSGADLRVDAAHRSPSDAHELARLRFSREEAAAIVRTAGGRAATEWLDFQASLDNLRRAVAEPGAVLHLATHAIVDNRDAASSRLVFSRVDPSGKQEVAELRLNDIYNLRIRRELVVLSACRAADGPEVSGEGVLSLTRAFLFAGVKGVVAGQWKVQDRASAELMGRFYQSLVEGHTPPQALRAAQRALMRDPRWSGVENWAAFVFVGDWRIMPWRQADDQ